MKDETVLYINFNKLGVTPLADLFRLILQYEGTMTVLNTIPHYGGPSKNVWVAWPDVSVDMQVKFMSRNHRYQFAQAVQEHKIKVGLSVERTNKQR